MNSMNKKCSVLGCPTNHAHNEGPDRRELFPFPQDPFTKRLWVMATKRVLWSPRTDSGFPRDYICEIHFHPNEMYTKASQIGRKFRRPGAVPMKDNSKYVDHFGPTSLEEEYGLKKCYVAIGPDVVKPEQTSFFQREYRFPELLPMPKVEEKEKEEESDGEKLDRLKAESRLLLEECQQHNEENWALQVEVLEARKKILALTRQFKNFTKELDIQNAKKIYLLKAKAIEDKLPEHLFNEEQMRMLASTSHTNFSEETLNSSKDLIKMCGIAAYNTLRNHGMPIPSLQSMKKRHFPGDSIWNDKVSVKSREGRRNLGNKRTRRSPSPAQLARDQHKDLEKELNELMEEAN